MRGTSSRTTSSTAQGGATGKEYLVVVDIDAPGKPGKVFLVGHYDDTS
jgi:hypothetical protein